MWVVPLGMTAMVCLVSAAGEFSAGFLLQPETRTAATASNGRTKVFFFMGGILWIYILLAMFSWRSQRLKSPEIYFGGEGDGFVFHQPVPTRLPALRWLYCSLIHL